MPLFIAGQCLKGGVTEQTMAAALSALDGVPQPKIQSDVKVELGQHPNELTVLQSEFGHVDRAHLANPIKAVATKNLISCFYLILYNELDSLAIHIDHATKLELSTWLQRFHDPDQLNAVILGGDCSEPAHDNLKKTVNHLLQAAEDLDSSITVQYKAVNQDLALEEQDKKHFIFDKIITKAEWLKRHLYGKPLNKSELQDYSVDDLDRSLSSDAYKKCLAMVGALSQSWCINKSDNEAKIRQILSPLSLANERQFYQTLKPVFSQPGFQMLKMSYDNANLLHDTKLSECKFDLETGEVTRFSDTKPVPYEGQRLTRMLESQLSDCACFDMYDPQRRQVKPPILSRQAISLFNKYVTSPNQLIDQRAYSALAWEWGIEESVVAKRWLTDIIYSGGYHPVTPISQLKQSNHRFAFKKAMADFYNNQFQHTTAAVDRLNQMMPQTCYGQLRRDPDIVFDALIDCTSIQEAEALIQRHIAPQNLSASVIKFADTGPKVCIPAINMTPQASRIEALPKPYELRQ